MHRLCIGNEQRKCCQCRGSDGKAFSDRRCCISYRIQLICNLTDRLIQPGHFRNTTCIIRNRSVRINCHGNCRCRKHSDCCQRNAVKSAALVRRKNSHTDQKHRRRRGFHSNCHTTDDGGRRPSLRLGSDLLDRLVIRGSIHLCNHSNEKSYCQTGNYRACSPEIPKQSVAENQ